MFSCNFKRLSKSSFRAIALFILFIFFLNSAFAADTISGKVTDESGRPLEYATVALFKLPDSTQANASLTDDKGFFMFENIKHGEYYVMVSQIGFLKSYSSKLILSKNDSETNINIVAKEAVTALEEIKIVSQKPFVETQPDKTVVNVEQSVMNAGVSAIEVLKRTPGVSVDKDGAVELKGRDGVMVMINGKPMYMDDKQIGTLLKSLPADQIKNIEVITNPSAKYDAAGNAGIININLKKGALEGFNGSANASYGQGFYPKANGGVNVNYKKQKLSFTAGYQLNWRKNLDAWTVDRLYGPNNATGRFFTDNSYNSPGYNNNINFNGDYSFDDKNVILFNVNGNVYDGLWKGGSRSTILGQNLAETERLSTTENSNDFFYSGNAGATYKHKFDTVGTELSFGANYNRFDQRNVQRITTNFILSGTPQFAYRANVPVIVDQQNAQLDFTKPLSKNTKLETGTKIININSRSRVRGDVAQAGTDSTQENFFDYRENVLAVYMMGYQNLNKFSLSGGVRYEHTLGRGNQISKGITFPRDYGNFFPSAGITYKYNDKTTYSLTYGKRIDRPEYNELNPFVYYADPFNAYAGNPLLLPQITDNVEFVYSLFYGALTATLNYGYTVRPMGDVYRLNSQTLATTYTKDNLKSFENVGLAIAVNLPVTKWWNTSNYAYLYQNTFNGDIGFGPFQNRRISFLANSTQTFKLPEGIDVELSGQYEGPSAYSISRYNELWQISLGAQKSVFKEKATIKLALTDIFWTYVYRGQANLGEITTKDSYKWDNRVVTLTFIYNFGKKFTLPKEGEGNSDFKKSGGRSRN